MTEKLVTIEKRGRVAIVRFDAGDKANALSLAVMEELTEAARAFERDSEVSAVVLTGRADLFTLGFNLKDGARVRARSLAERRRLLAAGPRMCQTWEDLEPLTLVAIEGWCVGGGAALSVACDLRVIGETATFYVPEIERGMNMSWGSVPRIANLVGPARAKRIVIMAERVPAATALTWGLADEIAPAGRVLDAALRMAERVAAMPPVQVRMCKAGINAYANALAKAASALDRDQYLLAQSSADHAEAVAAFFERREPKYTGD